MMEAKEYVKDRNLVVEINGTLVPVKKIGAGFLEIMDSFAQLQNKDISIQLETHKFMQKKAESELEKKDKAIESWKREEKIWREHEADLQSQLEKEREFDKIDFTYWLYEELLNKKPPSELVDCLLEDYETQTKEDES